MKKLSDFKGEAAIDVLADILEPLLSITSDEEVKKIRKEAIEKKEKLPVYKLVKPALKNHKNDIFEIFAILNECSVDEAKEELTAANLPAMVVSLMSEPEIMNLFFPQVQTEKNSSASSGSATVNTEAKEN